VTIKRWDDIWLNEGFSTYATWLWVEHDLGEQAFRAEVKKAYDTLGDDSFFGILRAWADRHEYGNAERMPALPPQAAGGS
jgi:aminopeptidase N